MTQSLSVSEFNAKCQELGYTLLSEYRVLYGHPITVRCNDCGFVKNLAHASTLIKYPNKKCCNSRFYRKYSNEEFIRIMSDLGFYIISDYLSLKKPIKIQCKLCYKIFYFLQAKNALHAKCKRCFGSSRKYSITTVQEVCSKNNIIFLDEKFITVDWYHNFICHKNHYIHKPFNEILRSIKNGNNGCAECAIDSKRDKIENIKYQYEIRGFTFLNNEYKSRKTKYPTKCKKCNFVWETSTECILFLKSGCPKCNSHLNEKLTGLYLKELLPSNIHINTHLCLKEKIIIDVETIRNRIYIDYTFTVNKTTIFIEYNGEQHYKPSNFGQNENQKIQEIFRKQQLRDSWLKQYCQDKQIILIEIDGRIYKRELIRKLLQEKLNYHICFD